MVSTHHQETRCRAVARTRRGPDRRRRSGCSQRRRRRSSGSRRARSSPCGRGRRAGGAGRWRGGRGPFDGAAREEGAGVGPARGDRGGGRCARAEAEMPHAVNGTTLTTDSTTNATSLGGDPSSRALRACSRLFPHEFPSVPFNRTRGAGRLRAWARWSSFVGRRVGTGRAPVRPGVAAVGSEPCQQSNANQHNSLRSRWSSSTSSRISWGSWARCHWHSKRPAASRSSSAAAARSALIA
jgi:hypothetical protein